MGNKPIFLTAGGTGGHFFPALATANELAELGHDVHLITDKRCQKYIQHRVKEGDNRVTYKIIDLYLKTDSSLGKLLAPIKIAIALLHSMLYVLTKRPALTIGFGGYPSFPILLAARIFSVPIVLHEQNRFLGRVNRFFSKSARLVAFSYETSQDVGYDKEINYQYVGDVIRQDISNIKIEHDFTGEPNSPFRILIYGGSQGAKIFSSAVPEAIGKIKKEHPEFHCSVIQQAPQTLHAHLRQTYETLAVKCELAEFFHDIHDKYGNTDLLIARAGASTIAEISAIGLPAILIPFPYASENHQEENARYIEEIGGGWMIGEDTNLSNKLADKIYELSVDRPRLLKAAKKIQQRKSDGLATLVAIIARIVE